MNPAELDMKQLKGLSKKDLARLVLSLSSQVGEKEREIERHKAFEAEIAAVLRKIAENAEQMKLAAKQYYLASDDPVATDINAQIDRIVAVQIATLHRLNGLLHGMKPGSERSGQPKSGTNAKPEGSENPGNRKKKKKLPDHPHTHLKQMMVALGITDMNTPVGKIIDAAQRIIEANKPEAAGDEDGESHQGKCRNIDGLPKRNFKFAPMPIERQCPHCGETALEKSVLEKTLKSFPVDMQANQGVSTPYRIYNYLCPHCNQFHTVCQGADHPIATTRTMGLKAIVMSMWLHFLGMPLNRAGASFENGALLGSDTLNRSAFEWGRIYILPLYESLLRMMKEQKIIAADETVYNVSQPMGYGKMPQNANGEATCSQTYVLSISTTLRSLDQLHAYALLEGRGRRGDSENPR